MELPPEKRQVVDIKLNLFVSEYQAQFLKVKTGNIYKAPFPESLKAAVHYGPTVRSFVTYMSNHKPIQNERLTYMLMRSF